LAVRWTRSHCFVVRKITRKQKGGRTRGNRPRGEYVKISVRKLGWEWGPNRMLSQTRPDDKRRPSGRLPTLKPKKPRIWLTGRERRRGTDLYLEKK